MKQVLLDYLEICSRFRKDGLSKLERRLRHTLLTEWAKKHYADDNLTIPELYEFWDKHGDMCHNRIFFEKVIVPVVDDDMKYGNIEGLKFLFYCLRGYEDVSFNSSESPVSIFCDAIDYQFGTVQLADMVLEKEPEEENALKYKYHHLLDFFEFSIHEMPTGILNGMNGASKPDIPEMLKDIDEFERISGILNMPLYEDLINSCRKYYTAYGDYLQNLNQYESFEEYMHLNNISY